MPWIDPKKEADAHETHLRLRITSPQTIIRSRGQNPDNILDQCESWEQSLRDRGLKIESTDPATERGFSYEGD